MEPVFKEETLHLWYGKPNKVLNYSTGGKNFEVLFAVTQLDDKSIHAVFSCPGGLHYYDAKNNNYLKESKVFNSYEELMKELNIAEDFQIDKIFCYNLFKGKQKSFVFKARNGKYYQYVFEYNYDTHFSSKKISPLSGNPMDQCIYEKEMQFENKTDNIPHEIQEKLNKHLEKSKKYNPEDLDKVITTPNNKITFLSDKKLKCYNSKSFQCENPMAIDEIKKLAKEFSESINSGYGSRNICTAIEDYNKTVSENKQISRIISFHHATFYDDKYCACDCNNDYVGLTNEFELCSLGVYSYVHQKEVDPEIKFSIINF